MIRQTTESAGYEFRLTYPYEEYFLSQTLALYSPYANSCNNNSDATHSSCTDTSPAGQYLAPLLCDMAEHNYIYNQGIVPEAWDFFCKQFAARFNNASPLDKTFTERKDASYHFAFDYLDIRTPHSVLYQRYLNATSSPSAETTSVDTTSIETPMCLGAKCTGCGSCSPEQRVALEKHTLVMPNETDRIEIAALAKEKAQAQPVYIEVDMNDEL